MRPRRWLRVLPPVAADKHRTRDTLLTYGGFSVVILILGTALGRGFGRSLVIAAAVFVFSSLWAMYRMHRKP
ncbi:MAG TPA: hypothetical protein VGH52_04500 [Gaiellaceae bacterium]|jgi:hypothetical protein